jgi:hypothetical protein
LLICAGCGALFAGLQVTAPAMLGSQYTMQVCAGIGWQPRFQVGVWWSYPWISALPPVMLPNPTCVWLPWLPLLPPIGGYAFPP